MILVILVLAKFASAYQKFRAILNEKWKTCWLQYANLDGSADIKAISAAHLYKMNLQWHHKVFFFHLILSTEEKNKLLGKASL